MDVTALVPWLTPVVTAAAPHLLTLGEKAAEKAFEKIAESLGEDTWKWGKTALQKLWPKVEANPLALAATQEVAKVPDNPLNQQMLALALQKLLENDQALAAELERLRAAAAPGVTQAGNRNIVSAGDHNINVSGDGNTIRKG
jgi:hypothetical protein